MILVDSSVWVDHLQRGDATLATLLNASRVLGHPYMIAPMQQLDHPSSPRVASATTLGIGRSPCS